jgi:rubrerythrin
MKDQWTGENVLRFAIDRELQSHNFYLQLRDMFEDETVKDLMLTFAQAECEHKENLELELMKRGRVIEPLPCPAEMLEKYPMPQIALDYDIDYVEAILLAIDKEEADFRLYVNMASETDDAESRDILYELSQQEIKHKFRWQNQYDKITDLPRGD